MRYFVIFFLVILTSCAGKKNDKEIYFDNFPEVHNLAGDEVDDFYTYLPSELMIVDTFMVILNNGGRSFFQIINTKNHSLLCEFGQKGRGENEYIEPDFTGQVSLNSANEKCIDIIDAKRRLYSRLNILKCIRHDTVEGVNFFHIPREVPSFSTAFYFENDKMFFSPVGPKPEGRFFIYDFKEKITKNIPFIPDLGFKISPINKYPVYVSATCVNENEKILALAPAYMGEIDFFDTTGSLLKSIIFDRPDMLKKAYEDELIFKYNPKIFYSKLKRMLIQKFMH